jgi:hypothetical protein
MFARRGGELITVALGSMHCPLIAVKNRRKRARQYIFKVQWEYKSTKVQRMLVVG